MTVEREEWERRQQGYRLLSADPLKAAERDVLGSDYQANGYTTRAQADELGDLLGLGPGMTLLDLGSGCGWPGVYLASHHGCRVVSVDPVLAGAVASRSRVDADGLSHRSWSLVGDATGLPLRARSVDAIVHTDVMC